MYGKKLRNTLIASAAVLAMGMSIQSASAAGIQSFWKFNLDAANGKTFTTDRGALGVGGAATSFSGLGIREDINNLSLDGFGFISQDVVGDGMGGQVAVGNPFAESGFLNISGSIFEPGPPSNSNVALSNGSLTGCSGGPCNILGDAGGVYFQFDGLTGTLNLDGSITFDPGVGTIRLLLDSDVGTADPSDGDILELATFEIIAPSGGAAKDFFGGAADDSVIAITLVQKTEFGVVPVSGVSEIYLDENGDGIDIDDEWTLHLGNVNAQLIDDDPNDPFDPFSFTPTADPNDDPANGTVDFTVQNAGQYNIEVHAEVPAPSSLAALGFGMLALGGLARRRRRKAA